MRLDIYVHVENSSSDTSALARIEKLLAQVLSKEQTIMTDLASITQAVQDNDNAEQAAITLLGNLHDLLTAAGTDPVALQALADDLNTHKDALAAAVVANTPAAVT